MADFFSHRTSLMRLRIKPRTLGACRADWGRVVSTGLVIGLCVSLVVLPIAVLAGTKTFDIAIPATTADESIRLLSRQTGHSAIFQSGDVAGIQTNPVQGQYTLHRALDALLAGTGLTARLTEKNVITILYRAQDAGEEDMVTVDKKVGLLASVAAFLLGAGASDEVLAQAEPAADEDRRTLEEIVVTATRREASLQDVGVSVSALSNNFLDEIGANDLNDFFGFVPSVNAASNTIGERGGLNIVIRGISNSRISSGNDSSSLTATTGYYINDIRVLCMAPPRWVVLSELSLISRISRSLMPP